MNTKLITKYLGATITRNGITFDTNKVNEEDYGKYAKCGFADLFEEIKVIKFDGIEVVKTFCKECNNKVCSCKVDK